MSLNKLSGYDALIDHYNKNKDKPWQEWLVIEKIFEKPGKQGIVGLMAAKDNDSIKYVFKISQYINYLAEHEFTVTQSLNNIADFCPHFCRSVGMIVSQVNPEKCDDPFDISKSKYKIQKEILLLEFLDKSYKFYNYINSDRIKEEILYSIIKQVFMALSISQKRANFTHYDLHSNNIMIKKCSKDLVFLYITDDGQFYVPTYGYYPVIIDYGFSYSNSSENEPLYASLNNTEIGFMSDRFDPFADPKLFLVTVSDEIRQRHKTKNSLKLKRLTKDLFNKLNIDWDSGWDKDTKKCATDMLINKLRRYSKISNLFSEYNYYCFDIINSLIILPLQEHKQKCTSLEVPYFTFLKEFIKIENELTSPFFCLYVLKAITDLASVVRQDYIKPETRTTAINFFESGIKEKINEIIGSCTNISSVHFEKMLCGLLCMIKGIETILYFSMLKRTKTKRAMYDKIPVKSIDEIFRLIDKKIPSNYVFNENTTVLAVDNIKGSCYPIHNKKSCLSINGSPKT